MSSKYFLLFLVVIPVILMASRSRDGSKDQEVLAHMTVGERLAYYGMAAAVGLSIPLAGLGIAWLIRLVMPSRSALESLIFASIVLLPALLIAGVWCKEPMTTELGWIVPRAAVTRALSAA